MRALIMTDTHAQGQDFELPKETFDCLLLCGDNAETSHGLAHHHKLFQDIREQFSGPMGFVAGNHDLWTVDGLSSWDLLYRELPRLAAHYDVTYLENQNLSLNEWTMAGTYGHYDYSMSRVPENISRLGEFNSSQGRIHWMDMKRMRWENKNDTEVCHQLIKGFAQRISGLERNKLITISHTTPHKALVGHPESDLEAFLNSYSGSELLGKIISKNGGRAHYCGHTHAKAKKTLGFTHCFNIGNDYGGKKYLIFDSEEFKEKIIQTQNIR